MNSDTQVSAAPEAETAPPARFDTLPLDAKLLRAVGDKITVMWKDNKGETRTDEAKIA